ncbi:putative plant self-incompatibility S1 [Medicago truncatula]|uniref:S-protein homolog n=1 Tax=Medicago truncatula TaxID=3880 RepID=A0A072UD56_MEDTR|nr:plant self-incompatibility protein S1 family protein [Medicago truncatula]RHN52759.1 putative plant self-incompatibility S1 [Medicago truncatula]
MTVHCKSKNDDLGFHTIMFGQSYVFSFKPIVFPIFIATLFFCSFTWPQDPNLHYLDVYDAKNDDCRDCSWKINVDGGCLNGECRSFNKNIQLMDARA